MSVVDMWADLRENRVARAVGLGLAIVVAAGIGVVLLLFFISVFFQVVG